MTWRGRRAPGLVSRAVFTIIIIFGAPGTDPTTQVNSSIQDRYYYPALYGQESPYASAGLIEDGPAPENKLGRSASPILGCIIESSERQICDVIREAASRYIYVCCNTERVASFTL